MDFQASLELIFGLIGRYIDYLASCSLSGGIVYEGITEKLRKWLESIFI